MHVVILFLFLFGVMSWLGFQIQSGTNLVCGRTFIIKNTF